MPTVIEVEQLALELTEPQRAALAARLLSSLPPMLADEDEGMAEALRRDADFDTDPSFGLSLEEFRQKMRADRT